jgi:NADH-quinone oxidoreductase subunit G
MGALMESKNVEARLFQRFMNAYSSISGEKHYSGSVDKIKNADAIIVLGTRIATESPEIYDALRVASEKNCAKVVYAHPIEDVAMQNIATQFMKYEPGSEEGVLALLAYYLLVDADLSEDKRRFLDDLDLAYLEAESNTGEEEFEEMIQSFENSESKAFIVGNDVMAHERAENIARLCALIEKNSDFSLLVVPNEVNGISESLNSEAEGVLEEIEELPEFNGTVIYQSNPSEKGDVNLRGSAQFAQAAKISDGDFILVSFGGQTINREFKVEHDLKGTIALNPTFDIALDAGRYKFERSEIKKINQNSESDNE